MPETHNLDIFTYTFVKNLMIYVKNAFFSQTIRIEKQKFLTRICYKILLSKIYWWFEKIVSIFKRFFSYQTKIVF